MLAHAQLRAAAPLPVAAPSAKGRSGPRPGCRLTLVRDAAPFAFRATPEAVYLVGTAASPVGDDDISLEIEVEAGATLCVRAAASMIAWASTGSSLEITVRVGPGGHLDWHLPPLIASSSCRFFQLVKADLAAGATMRWAEEIVLGRHGEPPGRLGLRLDVDYDAAPLLRHQLELGPGVVGWDGPAVLGANRAAGLVLVAGRTPTTAPGVRAAPNVRDATAPTAGPGWAKMALEGPGSLVSAIGPDILSMRSALAQALCEQGG